MDYQLEILLSTYNGEQFLREQVDSLLSQSFSDWRLLIRDDGSTDTTVEIINEYVRAHSSKIVLLTDDLGNIGASQSYAVLISRSNAAYVAFSDQDDVWLTDKLAIQMGCLLEEEKDLGADFPLLINTNLQVTDQSLNKLSPSFWQYQNLNPQKKADLRHLLIQNHITGCTYLMNRALLEKVLPISSYAVMHDWWIALIAASLGKIVSLDTSTVLYRQHAGNVIGAKKWKSTKIIKDIFNGAVKSKASFDKTKYQAKALLESGLIEGESKMIIKKYVDLFDMEWLEKRKVLVDEGFYKQGFLRNAAMFLYI